MTYKYMYQTPEVFYNMIMNSDGENLIWSQGNWNKWKPNRLWWRHKKQSGIIKTRGKRYV